MSTLKMIIVLAFLCVVSSSFASDDFQNFAENFANDMTKMSNNVNDELSAVERASSTTKFYANEIMFRVQPELGVAIAGISGLKFALTAEFTFTRKLPSNLVLDKP